MKPTSLEGWLQYIEAQHPKTIAMGLERVQLVKNALGLHPQFPCIVVAGTNGKGSTCAMLESIYTHAGYRVGCYTSPHILRYNERTKINQQEISDSALVQAFSAVEEARGEVALTYFEFGTLAAMWLFMQEQIEVAILEVGLGGRLDAVNVFDADCAVVTSIDLDHMEYLGDTRESIGFEKAGVYRKDLPAICGDDEPPHTLKAHAIGIGAHYMQIHQAFDFNAHAHVWDFMQGKLSMVGLSYPALKGQFQLNNAACVVATIQAMQSRLPVTQHVVDLGLRSTALMGRFQQVSDKPLTILDVAHNPHAAQALANNLHQQATKGKTIAVFAMLADKDIAGVIGAVADEIDVWHIATIASARGANAEYLRTIFNNQLSVIHGANCTYHADVSLAYQHACIEAGDNDRIIVFGSFFTVADVLSYLSNQSR